MKRLYTPLLALALCASGCGGSEALKAHDNLPPGLPRAVAAELGAVAALNFIDQPDFGSAVNIDYGNGNFYISAGHIIMNGNSEPKAGSREIGALQLYLTSKVPKFSGKEGRGFIYTIGKSLLVAADSGSYVEGDTGTTPDIALLEAPYCNTRPKQVLPEIAQQRASAGSDVFFVNYEPVTNKLFRDPLQQNTLSVLKTESPYRQPAIYGGIVTGYQQNGDYIIDDGLKNYGVIPQTFSRPGASGGAVFNREGQLLGISIEASADTSEPQTTIVQAISQKLIDRLAQKVTPLSEASGSSIC